MIIPPNIQQMLWENSVKEAEATYYPLLKRYPYCPTRVIVLSCSLFARWIHETTLAIIGKKPPAEWGDQAPIIQKETRGFDGFLSSQIDETLKRVFDCTVGTNAPEEAALRASNYQIELEKEAGPKKQDPTIQETILFLVETDRRWFQMTYEEKPELATQRRDRLRKINSLVLSDAKGAVTGAAQLLKSYKGFANRDQN